ncbi:hypothetical protein D9Q98_005131 [Chlorella vulgaris]|uniref:Uncharacterized protein n=1 Tax=Chlorella vulgaris TaxID=3077 RepID=A0A9D4TNI5_CHLVU|nr:hypothetical protein D9Q98_005131 [Chlorella vulgaris]
MTSYAVAREVAASKWIFDEGWAASCPTLAATAASTSSATAKSDPAYDAAAALWHNVASRRGGATAHREGKGIHNPANAQAVADGREAGGRSSGASSQRRAIARGTNMVTLYKLDGSPYLYPSRRFAVYVMRGGCIRVDIPPVCTLAVINEERDVTTAVFLEPIPMKMPPQRYKAIGKYGNPKARAAFLNSKAYFEVVKEGEFVVSEECHEVP